MANKIWSFLEDNQTIKTPYQYLVEYANRLESDTNGLIKGAVSDVFSETDETITYALYCIVPQLSNYSFRLIEVVQKDIAEPYPVNMKLLGRVSTLEESNIGYKDFEKKLLYFIQSPLTKAILQSIKIHVEIKYSDDTDI